MTAGIRTLHELCVPRKSVFDRSRKDVVLQLSDLLDGRLGEQEAESFFAENFVTKGLKSLVTKTFERILGKRDQAATFLLSQAMGGGKTHSMLALGLLGKYPAIRKKMWPHEELGTAEVRVIGFDGRESDYPFGLWGALADQVGKKALFNQLYSPLQAPGVTSWINLLQGPPTIILLDELPPYFADALSKSIGQSNLAAVTTTAVSNLMIAANKAELSNVAIVVSDLSATAYVNTGTGVLSALGDLEQETNRSALNIEPVATQGNEVFEILKKRLFEKLPPNAAIDSVATAYGEVVKKAAQMELTNVSPQSYAGEIRDAYPFHFSLRDLYGRFKENPSFQQTRGLLRMMRAIVANLWESGRARELYLIHPYDIDLNDPEVYSEFDRVNPSLSEAVRTDIANGGDSYAEQLDAELKSNDATDAAKLIYVSSLSTAQKAIIGLRDMEVVAWLCAPGRTLERLITDVLEVLPNRAWYLHLSSDGRLYFKNVQNLAARLFGMVRDTPRENRAQELRRYLKGLFEPQLRDLYQDLYVLPPIDEVNLTLEKVALILTEPYIDARPDEPLHPEWRTFFDQQSLQNRVFFLTGDRDLMEEVYKNAAYLRAVGVVLSEQEREGVSPRDPQAVEAHKSLDKYSIQLRSSVQQTFTTVVYPSQGRLRAEHINLNFDSNRYDAERQIRRTLLDNQKFSEEAANDTWVKKAQDRLFDGQNPAPWNEIKKRAAMKTEWQLHHPNLLEDIRQYAERLGKWRAEGSAVRHGPFPPEPTSVEVVQKSFDEETGEAILQIVPQGGSRVFYEIGTRKPDASSKEVTSFQDFRTKELVLTFLCVDDQAGGRETGAAKEWRNKISIKGRFYGQGGDFFFEAIATPEVPLRYTTDGRDPKTQGTTYAGAFPVPAGASVIQVFAERDGVHAAEQFRVRRGSSAIDAARPLTWRCRKRFQNLKPSDGFLVLERAREYGAALTDLSINVVAPDTDETIYYTLPPGQHRRAEEITALAEALTKLVPNGQLTITVGSMQFDSGQALLDWQQRERLSIDAEHEVKQ